MEMQKKTLIGILFITFTLFGITAFAQENNDTWDQYTDTAAKPTSKERCLMACEKEVGYIEEGHDKTLARLNWCRSDCN